LLAVGAALDSPPGEGSARRFEIDGSPLEQFVAENQNVRYLVFMSALDRDLPSVQMARESRDINGLARLTLRERRTKVILPLKVRNPLKSLDSTRESKKIQANGSRKSKENIVNLRKIRVRPRDSKLL
jgi:hypothetical protein